jgi:hypothetical protein
MRPCNRRCRPATALVFSRGFYAHLGLLHLAFAMRIGSDVSGQADLARLGAMGGGIALLIFPLNTALALVRTRRSPRHPSSGGAE